MARLTKTRLRPLLLTAGAAILLTGLSGCSYLGLGDNTISELTANPERHVGHRVSVRGTVSISATDQVVNALQLPTKLYSIKDQTGEITVFTDQDLPPVGSVVHVDGRFSPPLTLGPVDVGRHIQERKRGTSDTFIPSGGVLALLLLLSAVGYVFGAFVAYRIGSKFGVGTFGEYCIPIYNYVLLCRCAQVSPLLMLWLLVPLANIGFIVYLWGTIATKLGRDFWLYGLGSLLFGITVLILAFDDSKPPIDEPPTVIPPSIYCISGEFAGDSLPVGTEGIIIGRSAGSANLVLSSLEISATHARVWSDRERRIWVQDMNSSNGTYYCRTQASEVPEWIEVKEPVVLESGTHFRLGDNVVEFVIS